MSDSRNLENGSINSNNSKNRKKKKDSNGNKTQKDVNLEQLNDLDKTDKIDLVFDDERLEKTELLDVSFINEPVKKNVDEKIEVLSLDDEKLFDRNNNSKVVLMILAIFVAFVLGFIVNTLFSKTKVETKLKVEKEIVVKNDENIVFLGDSLFDYYDVEKYFEGMHIVNSGISGNTTVDILNNMEERVYRYNPSTIFLLIGTNDLELFKSSSDRVVTNIEKIINEIKENRPYADIKVLSLLPVNEKDDEQISMTAIGRRKNSDILKINSGLKVICDEKKIIYIDMHSLFVDEEGNFKKEYTTEGLHVSIKGYEIMTSELMKYINKK